MIAAIDRSPKLFIFIQRLLLIHLHANFKYLSKHMKSDEAADTAQTLDADLESMNFCAPYIADLILAEVRDYFQVPLPATLAQELADHADWAVVHHPHYGKLAEGPQARAWIKSFMRRWLAYSQQKEQPRWYRRLPETAKLARLRPAQSRRKPAKSAAKLKT